jgi:hypothetical protein
MKHSVEISHNGITKEIVIEPCTYHNRTMYDVAFEDQFVLVYKNDDEWMQDDDHIFDQDWLSAVGNAIEGLPTETNNLVQSHQQD